MTRPPRRWMRTGRARPMPSTATARRWWNWRWTGPWARAKLLKITAAHDVGRAINPMLARGQIEGGIAQGIGWR
jgi:hypothetical protein